jgi:hypothetical protein
MVQRRFASPYSEAILNRDVETNNFPSFFTRAYFDTRGANVGVRPSDTRPGSWARLRTKEWK